MARVLHVQASPRERSYSRRTAEAFLEAYRDSHPGDTVETLHVFDAALPPFRAAAASAKMAVLAGGEPGGEPADVWQDVVKVIDHFRSFDKYVISSAMWNFSIPYPLKHYIDVIVQPRQTFYYDDQGQSVGMVTGKPAMLVLARGGAYPTGGPAAAMDMQRTYLELILKFIGFQRIEAILIEPTIGKPEAVEPRLDRAIEEARRQAKSF